MRLAHLVCNKESTLFLNAEYGLLPLKRTQSLRHKASLHRQQQKRLRDQKPSVEARFNQINTEMTSRNPVAGKKKKNDETPKKTQGSRSNQEQNDLAKKITNLEEENKKLSSENIMLKQKFDLREIMKALSQKGVKELDAIEIANDMVKMALHEAEEKHSAEIKDMEIKHKKEIEKLSQNLQGVDQLPTQSNGDSKHSQETDEEIAKYRAQNKELERELVSLKAGKDELNNNIKQLQTEKESLTKKLTKTDELLSKKDNEITDLKKQLANLTTRNQDAISKTVKPDDIHVLLRETTKEKEEAKSEKDALLAEKQTLEAEIQKLQNENKEQMNSYEKEKRALLADIQNRDAEIKRLQDEIKALKESEEKNNTPNEKNQDTISKTVNPDDIQVLLRETTKEKDDAKSEKKALLAAKQKLEAEIQKLQNENKEQKNSYEKTKDLMEKEKGALLADKQKMDADIKRLQDEMKALKQSEEKNKSLNEKLKKLEEQVEALQKENNEVKYRLKESQSPSLTSNKSANDNKTVQQLKVENERLLSRLSELAGAQMTHNNPNIADLSDGFRPTKLSEEYSQLYDNLWTDAFEEHSGKKEEEDVIKMLRKGLLGSYEFCEKVCREFTVQLTNSSLALPNSKPKKVDIPIVYKKQLQDMKKSFGVFLRNDVKESYRKQNTIEGGDKTKNYIDACVELCWLMVIQEPPVVIETPASKDSAFDTNTYRTYTKTGTKVDFVVWPALRLHQGGPLLTKGVAQGKS